VEARASATIRLNSNYPLDPIVRKTTEGKRGPQSALSVDCGGRCRAELATQVLGARAAAVAIAVRGVRGHSDAVIGADRHRGRRPAARHGGGEACGSKLTIVRALRLFNPPSGL
jgi:hypothetical protein